MRICILTGETGQLTFYDEVGKRLQSLGFEVSLCCDRDDKGVAEKVKKVADKNSFKFFKLDENFSTNELSSFLPKSLALKHVKKLNFFYLLILKVTPSIIFRILKKIGNYLSRILLVLNIPDKEKTAKQELKNAIRYQRASHRLRLFYSEKLFAKHNIEILILGEDGIGSNYWAITAAKRLGVKVVIIPFGMAYSNFLVDKGVKQKHAENDLININDIGGTYIKKTYPKWVKNTKFGEVLYFKPSFIIALEMEKINIRDPWCLQGGEADIILSEGPLMFDRYISEGVPREKLKITGSVYSDVLFDHIYKSKKLVHAYNNNSVIEEGKLKILVCVPPLESSIWYNNAQFKSLGEFFSTLKEKLKKYKNVQLTFSFHPRLPESTKKDLINLGIRPSKLPVFNLIAKNDILIMNNSSLCRWAILANKPVLNYDMYGFGSNYFPNCLGYFFTKNYKSFSTRLDAIISGKITYKSLSKSCKKNANKMSFFDGSCAKRIAVAIKNLG